MKQKIKKMLLLELGIVFLVLILFLFVNLNMVRFLPPCPMYHFFGILCPNCQGTRCVINFLLGNFSASFFYHPIFFITIVYLMVVNILFIINAFRKKEILTFLYPKTKFWIIFLVALGIFTVIRNIL